MAVDSLEHYDYVLPDDRIARHPPSERDGGRLYVVGPPAQHAQVGDLVSVLRDGDLLVVNDTKVLPARVPARRGSGGAVEVFFLGPPDGDRGTVLCRPARRLKPGEVLEVPGAGTILLEERLSRGRWAVRCEPTPLELMARAGEVPLPPYLGRATEPVDRERYQTVYAAHPGAVAAPTAGLHLSEKLLGRLSEVGVSLARVTLHVGAGTFRPLVDADLTAGRLHREAYRIPSETVEAVASCRRRGGRVVAVGTTSLRALESATPEAGDRVPCQGASMTELFIRPGYDFRCVDALLTNFHLPRSSLLMLVSAIVGREELLAAYAVAVREGYRFYSYGDAMFLTVSR